MTGGAAGGADRMSSIPKRSSERVEQGFKRGGR
jgi:hypothetical protein